MEINISSHTCTIDLARLHLMFNTPPFKSYLPHNLHTSYIACESVKLHHIWRINHTGLIQVFYEVLNNYENTNVISPGHKKQLDMYE